MTVSVNSASLSSPEAGVKAPPPGVREVDDPEELAFDPCPLLYYMTKIRLLGGNLNVYMNYISL